MFSQLVQAPYHLQSLGRSTPRCVRRFILHTTPQDLLQIPSIFKSHRWTHTWITWPGSLLFPSGIFAILLTFLFAPDCPDQTGTLHIPFLSPLWRQEYKHSVTLSSPSKRSVRLQGKLRLPSWAEIQGCGAYRSSTSSCALEVQILCVSALH